MQFSLFTAVAALSLVSVQAAPVVENVQVAAPAVESRTLGFLTGLLGGGKPWWIGSAKPYKMRAYCPGQSEVHDKWLNKRSDGTLGFEGSVDFQFYLDAGAWGGSSSWGGHPFGNSGNDMCVVGKSGFKDMMPLDGPGKSSWGKHGGGGYGSTSPSEYGSYGGWSISPLFPLLEILDVFGILSNKHFLQYQWGVGKSYGHDWICYKDGHGGYKVKYWDHKVSLGSECKGWFIIKIEVVKQSWWGKKW